VLFFTNTDQFTDIIEVNKWSD